MDIVKIFENDNAGMHVTIMGTSEEPLFRASDIGEILETVNIRQSIKDFDASEKHGVSIADAIGRPQETSFLTEKGLYKILFRSRKPIAEKFTNWVCEVLKEIRLTGKYELQKQLLTKDQHLEQTLIEKHQNVQCIYLGLIDDTNENNETLMKFGETINICQRVDQHRKIFKNFRLINVFKVSNSKKIETNIKNDKICMYISRARFTSS